MKHSALLPTLLAAGALAFTPACNQDTEAGDASAADATADRTVAVADADAEPEAPAEPTDAGLVARSAQRLELIEKADWIQSYDFLAPQVRRQQPLGDYLKGTEDNHYIVKRAPALIAREGRLGYLQVVIDWTPTHSELQTAANIDDGNLTQELDLTETWGFQDGEWHFLKWERSNEFRRSHPKLFRRDREASADTETASDEGSNEQ